MDNTLNNGLQAQRPGLSGSTLKTIAIVAMAIDHLAFAFVSQTTMPILYIVLRFIGRITGPVMFYLLVEGYFNTRNIFKYTRRMGIFALVSWLPFYYFEFGQLPTPMHFAPVGVIFTLWLGLLCMRAMNEIKNLPLRGLAVAGLFLLSIFGDWSFFGILYILVFYRFRGSFRNQAIAALVIIVLQCIPPFTMSWGLLIIQLGQILPLILLYFYNGERGRGGKGSKWFFYIFYPAHLLLIGLVKWGLPF